MTYEFEGRQPVVAMKQSNVCGAKGHSRKYIMKNIYDGEPCAVKVARTVRNGGKQPVTGNADGVCYLSLLELRLFPLLTPILLLL